jgi:hypothetical protein
MKTIIVLAAACALAACTSTPQPDPYCAKREKVTVTVSGQPHQVDGGCVEWSFGPTRRQREEFDKRSGVAPQK